MRRKSKSSLFGKYRTRTATTRGTRRAARRRTNLSIEPLEARHLLASVTFQHGVGGYEGQQDTVIFSLDRDTNFGTEGHISSDQQDFNNVRQGLLKFSDIFGNQPGQIPFGATINSAILDVLVQDDSNTAMQMSLYRMQQDWDESVATWNSFGSIGGVQASEGESTDLPPDAVLLDSETDADRPATAGRFDVKKSLEYWAAGCTQLWLVNRKCRHEWLGFPHQQLQRSRPAAADHRLQRARRDGRLPNFEHLGDPSRREHRDANGESRCCSTGQYFRCHEHQLHGHRGRRQSGAVG